jgi:hypothetical protein
LGLRSRSCDNPGFWQRGDAKRDAHMVGVGQVLVIQGAALLVFDTVMAVLQGLLTTRPLAGVDLTPWPW